MMRLEVGTGCRCLNMFEACLLFALEVYCALSNLKMNVTKAMKCLTSHPIFIKHCHLQGLSPPAGDLAAPGLPPGKQGP